MHELPECLNKIQDECSLDVGHLSLNVYLKSFIFFSTEKPSSQQSEGKKRQRRKCQDSSQNISRGEKTGKNKQSNS